MSNKIKCVVVGDICCDIRRYGTSTRTSPEDPSCKVLSDLETVYELGMAGNVAAWLAAQEECEVTLCGLVGNDDAGYRIERLCWEQGISSCFPGMYEKGIPKHKKSTTSKERICHIERDRIHQLVRCDRDMAYEINSEERSRIIEETEKADLVVVADYEKGMFEGEHGEHLRRWIGENLSYKKVVVNSKSPNTWEELNISALICNGKEALDALAERGSHAMKTSNYIVTMGADGVNAYHGGYRVERYPSLATKVVDVTGAGDAFTAGFAFQYYLNSYINLAVDTGQSWAARCCAQIGCGAPTRAKD